VESFTTSQTLITPIVSAVNRTRCGGLVVVSRYAARDSTGRVCADIEPTGVSPSDESGEDRSLEPCPCSAFNTRQACFNGTDQNRTDLSELPDTSS